MATKNGKTAGRKPRFDRDKKIKVLVEANPRRKGTKAYKHFEYYTSGMKVSSFIEKGGTDGDLAWDIQRKHIRLE